LALQGEEVEAMPLRRLKALAWEKLVIGALFVILLLGAAWALLDPAQ
jgi:hypothetical protein